MPVCAVLMKSEKYIKHWCYTRGNIMLATRAQKRFYIAEIKVFKVSSVCHNVAARQTQTLGVNDCYFCTMSR